MNTVHVLLQNNLMRLDTVEGRQRRWPTYRRTCPSVLIRKGIKKFLSPCFLPCVTSTQKLCRHYTEGNISLYFLLHLPARLCRFLTLTNVCRVSLPLIFCTARREIKQRSNRPFINVSFGHASMICSFIPPKAG